MIQYEFQRCDDAWVVSVPRSAFGSGRGGTITIGTVKLGTNLTETAFNHWEIAHNRPRARELLTSPEMFRQLMLAREDQGREEQVTGTFLVAIKGTGITQKTRWHTYARAVAYAQERLLLSWRHSLSEKRAEFSRPESEVFHAQEVDMYGHLKVAVINPHPWGATPQAPPVDASPDTVRDHGNGRHWEST